MAAGRKIADALKAMDVAVSTVSAGGDDASSLLQARRLLAADGVGGWRMADGVETTVEALVEAHLAVRDVANRCGLGAVKAAERATRDAVVLRLQSSARPSDRAFFLAAAEAAFGNAWGRELRSVLLLAHKLEQG